LARRNLRDLPQTITALSERLGSTTRDAACIAAHPDDLVTIDDWTVSRNDAVETLGSRLHRLPHFVSDKQRFSLGHYRGLQFGLILHPNWPPEVYLQGAATRTATLSREHHGPRAVLNALGRLAESYASDCDRIRKDLGIAEAQLRDYQDRFGKPFVHESYLSELTAIRDKLKSCLAGLPARQAGTPAELTADGQSSASDVAQQIKNLKSAHTIDAAPERISKASSSAEEPVTTRIRRRMETVLESDT